MASTERVSFPGGWWADVRTWWSTSADSRMFGAWGHQDSALTFEEAVRLTLSESVVAANLPDGEGNAIPFGPEMWDQVDGRIGWKLVTDIRGRWAAWRTDTDPKGGAAPSDA